MPDNLPARIASFAKRVLARIQPTDIVLQDGSVLPPHGLRVNNAEQQNDACYLSSAIDEADRVVSLLGYEPHQLLVDIGCGQGRLAIGLARRFPAARYLGLDVARRSIDWCRDAIEARFPSYQFRHLDVVNARYNPAGRPLRPGFRLPVANYTADIVYMWGLVTNMEPDHLPLYAAETSRILRTGGKVFATANVEEDVPRVTINPEHYMPYPCRGPLHTVRYEKQFFLDVFASVGLSLTGFLHHAVGNMQSELYFTKAS